MSRVFLVRHGEDSGFDRRLNATGVAQAQEAIKRLQKLGVDQTAIILSSPANRAVETAEIIASGLGTKAILLEPIKTAGLRPDLVQNFDEFLASTLNEAGIQPAKDQDIVIVTHQMLIQDLKDKAEGGFSPAVKHGEIYQHKSEVKK